MFSHMDNPGPQHLSMLNIDRALYVCILCELIVVVLYTYVYTNRGIDFVHRCDWKIVILGSVCV